MELRIFVNSEKDLANGSSMKHSPIRTKREITTIAPARNYTPEVNLLGLQQGLRVGA